MKKTNVFRGLAAIMAFLLFVVVSASNLMFTYAGIINNALNVKTSEIVTVDDDSEVSSVYYDNPYGTDVTDKQNTLNMEMGVASENIAQAEEGAVLLKNENGALPLSQDSHITIFGNSSVNSQGTATSTAFEAIPAVSFLSAMKNALGADNINTILADQVYKELGTTSNTEIIEAPVSKITAYADSWSNDYNDAALVMLSRVGSESNDSAMYTSEGRHYMGLSNNEEELLDYLKSQKDEGIFNKIIVLINTDQIMELDWLDKYEVDACMLVGLPGAVGFTGIANVLTGKVSPSGHLVDTYAANSLSAPATTYAADNTYTWSNADWVTANSADNNNDGLNINYYVIYAEGIYVGYKYYETRYEDVILKAGNADSNVGSSTGEAWNYKDEVVYPFGYGLSYTTFEQELQDVGYDGETDSYQVKVKVTNTGSVAGKSVVEVYAQTPYGDYERENQVEKAAIQFVGMEKTQELKPGESVNVTVPVERYLLASYDTNGARGYILSSGDYYLAIGESAHDALNNVLSAKGYSVADGMDYDGNTEKVYSWNQAELDTESYRTSLVNDIEVTNAFDFADINYYGIDFTYLSRNDWEATYPAEAIKVEATEEMVKDLGSDWYEIPENSPSVSDFQQGEANDLKFADLRLTEWDDQEAWDKMIDQLTVGEMTSLLLDGRGNDAIDSIGMPAVKRADDNMGISSLVSVGGKGISWASEVMTARTWNKERYSARGEMMAIEAAYCGLSEIWYGGGNIHRTAIGGRIRQYYSEDGNFGYIVGAYEAQAMQDNGIIYCIKHFALNEQETNRESVATFSNEQAIREVYLRAFEGAIVKGGALGVMTAFNRLGCTYAAVSSQLINTVLKGEWGFKGHVTTDGYTSTAYKKHFLEQLAAGVDYVCMDSSDYATAVAEAINNGDGHALELLRLATKHNLYAINHTVAQNGLSSNSIIITVVPWWEKTLLCVTVVLIVGLVACTAGAIVSGRKSKHEQEHSC